MKGDTSLTMKEGLRTANRAGRWLRRIAGFIVILALSTAFQIYIIWKQLAREADFRRFFGDQWRAQYELIHGAGALSSAHTRMIIAAAGIIVIPLLAFWLIRVVFPPDRDQY